jgi:hypothetical protein
MFVGDSAENLRGRPPPPHRAVPTSRGSAFLKDCRPEIVHDFRNRFVRGLAVQRRRAKTAVCVDQGFAKAHDWSATILDPGIWVTFRRLKPGETDAQSLKLAKAR